MTKYSTYSIKTLIFHPRAPIAYKVLGTLTIALSMSIVIPRAIIIGIIIGIYIGVLHGRSENSEVKKQNVQV